MSQKFTSEEMQLVRDQYEERLKAERERRDELEWKLRLEIAQLRAALPPDKKVATPSVFLQAC